MAMIKCAECGKDISDSAAACPGCGAPVNRPEPVRKKKMGIGKKLLIGFVALIALGAISNALKTPEEKAADALRREQQALEREQQKQQDAATPAPTAQADVAQEQKQQAAVELTIISPQMLFAAFDNNEVAAEAKYLKKKVALQGRIYKIESSILGYPEISFDVAHGVKTVKCQLGKQFKDAVAQMNKGETVTVIGTVKSFTLGLMVSVDDCELAVPQ